MNLNLFNIKMFKQIELRNYSSFDINAILENCCEQLKHSINKNITYIAIITVLQRKDKYEILEKYFEEEDECFYDYEKDNPNIDLIIKCNADFISDKNLSFYECVTECIITDINNFNFDIKFKDKVVQQDIINNKYFNMDNLIDKIEIKFYRMEDIFKSPLKLIKLSYSKQILHFTTKSRYLNDLFNIRDTKFLFIDYHQLEKIINDDNLDIFKTVYDFTKDTNYIFLTNLINKNNINVIDNIFKSIFINEKFDSKIIKFLYHNDYYTLIEKIFCYIDENCFDINKLIKFSLDNYLNMFKKWFTIEKFNNLKLQEQLLVFNKYVQLDINLPDLKNSINVFNNITLDTNEFIDLYCFLQKRNLYFPDTIKHKLNFNCNVDKLVYLLDLYKNNNINIDLSLNLQYFTDNYYDDNKNENLKMFIDLLINKNLLIILNTYVVRYIIYLHDYDLITKIFDNEDNLELDGLTIPANYYKLSLSLINYCYKVNKFIPIKKNITLDSIDTFNLCWKYLNHFNYDKDNFNILYSISYNFHDYIFDNYNLNKFSYDGLKRYISNYRLDIFQQKLFEQNQKKNKSAKK